MRWHRLILSCAVIVSLAACQPFAPDPRKGTPLPLPGAYSIDTEQEEVLPDAWWKTFGSEELDHLVSGALTHNFSVRKAWARMRQAQAAVSIAGASLYPQVNAQGSTTGNRSYSQTSTDADYVYADSEAWKLGVAASYELDLWGRIAAERSAAVKDAFASRQDLESAAMTVAAEVATAWVNILATRAERRIMEEQVSLNEKQLDLQKLRFANGLASALDVSQQQEVVAGSKAELPLLDSTEQVYMNSLAYLVGRSSASGLEIADHALPEPIPLPRTGIPSQLLTKRPDVRAELLRLESSDWDVAAARADRLPSFSLSAEAAYSSVTVGILFDNWIQKLAASFVAPLIDGGTRRAEVERQRAIVEEQLVAYQDTLAGAVQEVENALVQEKQQRAYIMSLEEELEAARQARMQARLRYLQGQSDYLTLITEILSVQKIERSLVVQRAKLLNYRITLHRALGGNWTQDLQESASNDALSRGNGPKAQSGENNE